MLLNDFFNAFRAGRELANAETWKRAQVATNSLVALLTAGVAIAAAYGHPVALDDAGIQSIAGAVVALVGLFNASATVVSTSRIGFGAGCGAPAAVGASPALENLRGVPPAPEPVARGGADGTGHGGAERGGRSDSGTGYPLPGFLSEQDGRPSDVFNNRHLG